MKEQLFPVGRYRPSPDTVADLGVHNYGVAISTGEDVESGHLESNIPRRQEHAFITPPPTRNPHLVHQTYSHPSMALHHNHSIHHPYDFSRNLSLISHQQTSHSSLMSSFKFLPRISSFSSGEIPSHDCQMIQRKVSSNCPNDSPSSNSLNDNHSHSSSPSPSMSASTNSVNETADTVYRLEWKNLSYRINQRQWKVDGIKVSWSQDEKEILQPQSGELVGGTITALMGPSGAGKSTLLNCITGRLVDGVSGDITVRYPREKKNVKIAYVPQKDYLFPQFTVRESLLFASKMKNVGKDHEKEAMKVIQALNLESCAEVRISGCSGGEVKRVSIGVELISGPNILVLDEPTSGLDSTNAIKCIRLLRDLAEKSGSDAPAIVATIHQPNHRIFTDFHKIYLLSRNGQNIYFGSPTGMASYFNSHSLVQPEFSSPADYAIEVASGSYGMDVFETLSFEQKKMRAIEYEDSSVSKVVSQSFEKNSQIKVVPIQKVMSKMRRKRSRRSVDHMALLTWRSIQASCFKSSQLLFKVFINVIIAILISLLWNEPTGTEDGCWQSTDIRTQLLSAGHEKINPREAYMDKITKITANCNLLFSTCVYLILVYSIGTVLVIPLEIKTVSKEISNSWYTASSYFVAKTVSDLPAVVLSIFSLEWVCWLATNQVLQYWRFLSAFGLSVLMGIVCESMGVLIGIILSHDLVSATLVTMASSFPVLMFGGFLIKIADIPWYFKPMTYVSYTRYTFEGILAAVYGFGRCREGAIDSVDFMQELSAAQNPIEVISSIVHTFNVTHNDARLFAPVIGVPESHLESVINGTIEYLGLDNNEATETTTDLIVSTASSQASYVMAYFKLNDEVLQTSFISLLIIIVAIKIAIFYLLSIKTRQVH